VLRRLLREAARRRLTVLDGYVLHDNTPMLRLLRSSGRSALSSGVVSYWRLKLNSELTRSV